MIRLEISEHKGLGEGKNLFDLDGVQRTVPSKAFQVSLKDLGPRWLYLPTVCQGLEEDLGYLVGDCLLAAAFLSYMGPFLTNYRDEIVNQIWMKKVTWGPGMKDK